MQNLVAVGLSDVKIARGEEDVLVAYSLGSCVGLALWDPVTKIGGMAHVVLPSSSGTMMGAVVPQRAAVATADGTAPGKHADTAVPWLVQLLLEAGCQTSRLKSWIAGGAHVLKGLSRPSGDIGQSNVKAVLEAAGKMGLRAPASDVGEDYGRTMRLYVSSGRATVSSVGRPEREL
jgi:chemotaxis protein CheD